MGGSIFNGNIESVCISWMMVLMVVAACIWEAFTGYLDRTFESKSHAEMLSKVYKELMILGFIAFGVIMSKEFGLHMSPTMLHCFEFCDLLLSISVLLYVLSVAMSATTMHVTQREWDRMAMKPVSQVINDRNKMEESRICAGGCTFITDVGIGIRETDFKVLQLLFKTKFHLHHHFDYVQYIKIILEDTVVDMANITSLHWALICAINGIWYFLAQNVTNSDITGSFLNDEEMAAASTNRRQLGSGSSEKETPEECRAIPTLLDHHAAWTMGDCKTKSHHDFISDAFLYLNNITAEHALYDLGNITKQPIWSGFVTQCQSCQKALGERGDLSTSETLLWILVFGAVGWLTVFLQAWILHNIRSRMHHVLKLHNATTYKKAHKVLKKLNAAMIELTLAEAKKDKEQDKQRLDSGTMDYQADIEYARQDIMDGEDDDTVVDVREVGQLHYVNLAGLDFDDDDLASDHKMKFKDGKGGFVTSDKVLSYKAYEMLIFLTKFFQLVTAMYLGFYFCHMVQRPAKTNHSVLIRLGMHAFMAVPVFVMAQMLVPAVVKSIALLVGVLHLNSEAVSQVLVQMETVRSIRQRVKTSLEGVAIVDGKANKKLGQHRLEKARSGEVSLLETLNKRPMTDRITRTEFYEMFDKVETLTTTKQAKKFLSREHFEAFLMEPPHVQATSLTSRTLKLADHERDDTITINEACRFLLRKASEAHLLAKHNGVKPDELEAFEERIVAMDCVTDQDLQSANNLAAYKALFKTVDRDKSGHLSRRELFLAFHKFKIPMTRDEYKLVTRIIDPDQSGALSMEEWIDFMMATEDDLTMQEMQATSAEADVNIGKGTGVIALVEEGTTKVLGDRTGGAVAGILNQGAVVVNSVLPTSASKTGRETDITDDMPSSGSASSPEQSVEDQAHAPQEQQQPQAQDGDAGLSPSDFDVDFDNPLSDKDTST